MTSDEAAMLTTAQDSSIRQGGRQMVAARAHRPVAASAALRHAADHQRAACCGRVGSGRAHAEAAEHRLSCTAAQALLKAARGPTSSSPHAGCTLGACMLGGLIHAWSEPSARISRPLVTPWPPCGTRSDRRSRDLLVSAVDRSENQDLHVCAV